MAFLFSKKFWLNLLFPIHCLACGQEAENYLCPACLPLLKFDSPNFSFQLKHIEAVFLAGNYENFLLADLIKKFKFNAIIEIEKILSNFLILFWQGQSRLNPLFKNASSLFKNASSPKEPLVIPVPLSKKRQLVRGFNQAELLARSFAAAFDYELNFDLKKIKNTKAQAQLNQEKRQKNLTGAFAWTGKNLKGRKIILIDDVVTTGATIEAAGLELKKAGAGKIIALGVAKG